MHQVDVPTLAAKLKQRAMQAGGGGGPPQLDQIRASAALNDTLSRAKAASSGWIDIPQVLI